MVVPVGIVVTKAPVNTSVVLPSLRVTVTFDPVGRWLEERIPHDPSSSFLKITFDAWVAAVVFMFLAT